MSVYEYTVREDVVTPVVNRIRFVVEDFARSVLVSGVDIVRLKDALELRGGSSESEE